MSEDRNAGEVQLPVDVSELGDVLYCELECPGVYYISVKPPDSHRLLAEEYYIILENSYISKDARQYGIPLLSGHGLFISISQGDAGSKVILYEILRYKYLHGLPLPETDSLLSCAMYGAEFHPTYFGMLPVPQATPWGVTTRNRTLANGIYWLETDQCVETLAVSYPIWKGEFSEAALRYTYQTDFDKQHGIDNTISKVSMDSNHEITALTYSNSGDGTVLYKSAGFGTPDYTYTGANHTGMVSDSTVISRIKSIITSETGVAAASVPFAEISADEDNIVYTSESTEIAANNLKMNKRGWIDGVDNKRINIYADRDSVLLVDGLAAIEGNEKVFDQNGVRIGSVWELGSSGRKMYALYNGEYELSGTGFLKIEYMDSGYFDSIEEYNLGVTSLSVSIGDFATQLVTCRLGDGQMTSEVEIQPIHTYSAAELMELNRD